MNTFEDQLKNSWNLNSRAWTDSIRQEKIRSRKTVTNPAIINAILSSKPQSVLDVGCGEGWIARELIKKNVRVVGIDGSKSLIDDAKEIGGGEFYWMDYNQFSEVPTRIGTNFDVVVYNFSLLSEDIHSVLKASKNVLKKTGRIIIQTLHPVSIIQNDRYENSWKIENFEGMGEGYSVSMPWYYRTLESWIKEIHHAGFQLTDCYEPIDTNEGKPLSLILISKP